MNDETNPETNPGAGDETRVVPTTPEPVAPPEQADSPEQADQVEDSTPYGPAEPTLISEQPAPDTRQQRRTGSHPVNVGQLAMGLVFLTAVVAWGLIQSDTVTGDDIRWLLPLPWVIGGAIGLVAAAISGVRRHGVGR